MSPVCQLSGSRLRLISRVTSEVVQRAGDHADDARWRDPPPTPETTDAGTNFTPIVVLGHECRPLRVRAQRARRGTTGVVGVSDVYAPADAEPDLERSMTNAAALVTGIGRRITETHLRDDRLD